MKAFEIDVNGKKLDYRVGESLDLDEVRKFFSQKYEVVEVLQERRHVVGTLQKGKKTYFFKLATTEGISEATKPEFEWNKEFNRLVPRENSDFWVPKNFESGYFNNNLFYFITDKFEGKMLAKRPDKDSISAHFEANLTKIIIFSEKIQSLNLSRISPRDDFDAREYLIEKTGAWFEGIPQNVKEKYEIDRLLDIVESGYKTLYQRPRHGDFTPWHMFELKNGKLGLIDGEHAMASSIEYYDICYFIQRVFSVLQEKELAKKIFVMLLERNYNENKLRVVLAARAIGGFLDESLTKTPNYSIHEDFKKWVVDLI